TNTYCTVLYIGVTTNLKRRVFEHKNGIGSAFTSKYNANRLVYAEGFDRIEDAIRREKQLKKWNRAWKVELIEGFNPEWEDLGVGL
ncbi:MAG: GIY-YIG nuclease family protein, partial [Bacteroidetes bacterium]|nr:GIY-YIG nuclease family protein [Bacteroidota bacterium]